MNILGINLSTSDLWLLGAASACLAWLVPHRLSFWREREARRAAACVKFQNSVLTALSGLYPVPSNWPDEKITIIKILEGRFQPLQAAVAEFRKSLPWYKKFFFDRAWRIYRLGKDGREIDGQYYWQYVPHKGEGIEHGRYYKHDNTNTYKDAFKKNVGRLLNYAKAT